MNCIARDQIYRAATFGFFAALLSGTGQTYFIGLFGDQLRVSLELTEFDLGVLFGTATLVNGLLMFWLGAMADRLPLRNGITVALLCLGTGSFVIAAAANSMTLLAAFLLLRLGGQGLCGHLAIVTAARHSYGSRGRSVAIASTGFIAGEAIWPLLIVTALGMVNWRFLWACIGMVLIVIAIPALGKFSAKVPIPVAQRAAAGAHPRLKRLELFGMARFIAPLGVVLVSPFIVTAFFFHQSTISLANQWSAQDVASAFIGFAACQAIAVWLAGKLVDRRGAALALRFQLWPLAFAMLVLGFFQDSAGPWVIFALLGATAGLNSVIVGSLWAEQFGIEQLGLIRGVYVSLSVVATAISPMLLGVALTTGISISALALVTAAYAIIAPWPLARIAARAASAPEPVARAPADG